MLAAHAHMRTCAYACVPSAHTGGVEYDKYEQMLADMVNVNYTSGECVFRQGQEATSVYIVRAGRLSRGGSNSPQAMPCMRAPMHPCLRAPMHPCLQVTAGELEVATGDASRPADTAGASSASSASSSSASSGSSGGVGGGEGGRVIAKLGPGDHFGETALLEERKQRNTTVRCLTDQCVLKAMANETFSHWLQQSSQLRHSVRTAIEHRTNRRAVYPHLDPHPHPHPHPPP